MGSVEGAVPFVVLLMPLEQGSLQKPWPYGLSYLSFHLHASWRICFLLNVVPGIGNASLV